MDSTQFFQPLYNALALQRATSEAKYKVGQNNALMNLNQQRLGMEQQRLDMLGRQNALENQQQQSQLEQIAAFRNAAGTLENTPEGHAQLQRKFPMLYKQSGLSSMLPEQPKLDQGYQTFLTATGQLPSAESYAQWQRSEVAKKRAGATKIENNIGSNTPGRKKADEAFGEEYATFRAGGGYADAVKQMEQLDDVLTELESGKNLTGPLTGSVPDSVLKFTNPEAISAREKVEEVVQRNLRLILGAQFTEKEGERLIKRAYNPNLSEAENAQRVRRLLGQMRTALQAKQDAADYFEQNGTLTGWRGKRYSFSDFAKAIEGKGQKGTSTGEIKFLGFE